MWNGIDKRKFPRAHYKCLIHISTKDKAETISTRTENIGEGGVCVVLSQDLGLFKGVFVELDLENGVPLNIKCSGTIVWVVKKRNMGDNKLNYDTGIEFVDLNEDSKSRVTKVVQKAIPA